MYDNAMFFSDFGFGEISHQTAISISHLRGLKY